MALDVTGRIVQLLELQTGVSARGDWKKQEFILETEEQYPRKICISLWGDRINDIAGIQLSKEIITVSVTLESREFNGRWYTDVKGWRVQRAGQVLVDQAPNQVNASQGQSVVSSQVPPAALSADDFAKPEENSSFDDLPF
jgi:hypothetical protein